MYIYVYIYIYIYIYLYIYVCMYIYRQIDRQINRQIDRQIQVQIYIHSYTPILVYFKYYQCFLCVLHDEFQIVPKSSPSLNFANIKFPMVSLTKQMHSNDTQLCMSVVLFRCFFFTFTTEMISCYYYHFDNGESTVGFKVFKINQFTFI